MSWVKSFVKTTLKIILENKATGRRKNNPNVRDAGCNDNMIKSQFSVQPVGSNVRPGESKWNVIDDTPLPKKKRK